MSDKLSNSNNDAINLSGRILKNYTKSSLKNVGGFTLSFILVLSQIFSSSTIYFAEQHAYAMSNICMVGMSMPGCVPPAPTGLYATVVSSTSVYLSWIAPPGSSGARLTSGPFTIYRSTFASGPFTTSIGTSTATSFIDTSTDAGVTYYYEITVTNAGLPSPLSNTASVTTGVTSTSSNPLVNSTNPTIDVGEGPSGIAYDSAKGEVFVASYFNDTVSVIDDATNAVVSTIDVGEGPSGIAYDSAKGEVFVANYLDDTVSVIDDATNAVVSTIDVGEGPKGIAYDSMRHTIFATNYFDDTVSVINDATNTVVSTISVGDGPSGIAYDSAKRRMIVTNHYDDTVSVINDATNVVVSTISVGDGPSSITYDSIKGQVLVTNHYDDTVSVIDDATNNVVSTIDVGEGPSGVAYDYVMGKMFVANFFDDNVSILDDTVLQVPTGITARGTSPNSIVLSWDSSSDATSYSIYNSTSLSIPFTLLNTTTTTSYTDTSADLNPSTTYYYELSATNDNSVSALSNPISAMTSPMTPTGMTATNSSTSVTLSWTGSDGATSYRVFRSTNPTGIFYSLFANVKTTTYVDMGLAPNATYYYEITTSNNGGTSPPSSALPATTMPRLSVPTGVIGTALSANSIQVSWTASPGATSYTIYHATSASGRFYAVGTSTTTSFTDYGIAPNHAYYYKITATNAAGSSSLKSARSPPVATIG